MKSIKRGRRTAARRSESTLKLSQEFRNQLLGGEWKEPEGDVFTATQRCGPIPGWMKREKWLTPQRYAMIAASLEPEYLAQMIGKEELMEAVLRQHFGVDSFDDGVKQTARRVAGYYREFGTKDEVDYLRLPFDFTTFKAEKGQMVTCDHIEFSSMCAHHLLPFYGYAHVGYVPGELQVGLSKIPRLVHHFAHRPQVQERLGEQIAKELKERLNPLGVMVVIEARHTCMACRGVQSHNAMMRTSVLKGVFLTNGDARSEFLTLVRGDVL